MRKTYPNKKTFPELKARVEQIKRLNKGKYGWKKMARELVSISYPTLVKLDKAETLEEYRALAKRKKQTSPKKKKPAEKDTKVYHDIVESIDRNTEAIKSLVKAWKAKPK